MNRTPGRSIYGSQKCSKAPSPEQSNLWCKKEKMPHYYKYFRQQ